MLTGTPTHREEVTVLHSARQRPVEPGLLLALLLVPLVGLAYVVGFPTRPDYPGHLLAGAGATLLLGALVVLVRRPHPFVVVGTVLLAVTLGAVAEQTVFRLAEFDPVDLANQSLGAGLAGVALLECPRRTLPVAAVGAAGVALVLVGFRYAFA